MSESMRQLKLWAKKLQIRHFFDGKSMIKLAFATNSSMIGYIGAKVKLRWFDGGVLVSIIQENVRKCERAIVITKILDIEKGQDSVTFFTQNSRYEFHICG